MSLLPPALPPLPPDEINGNSVVSKRPTEVGDENLQILEDSDTPKC